MTFGRLLIRSLGYYWRTNLPVMLGCFVGASVLTGALLVGDSMRGSLRGLTLERLGRIDCAVVSDRFVARTTVAKIAKDLQEYKPNAVVAPVVTIRGSAMGPNGKHAYKVNFVGVGPEFWSLFPDSFDNDLLQSSAHTRVIANRALADRLEANEGEALTGFVERASHLPREATLGDRREPLRPLPLRVDRIVPDRGVGRFALEVSQQTPLNLFVPMDVLAKALERPDLANGMLFAGADQGAIAAALKPRLTLADYGLAFVEGKSAGVYWLESRSLTLSTPAVDAAKRAGAHGAPVLATLAVEMSANRMAIPYSVVAAVAQVDGKAVPTGGAILNRWAAEKLAAKVGDKVSLKYHEVLRDGRLVERTAEYSVAGTTPIAGFADDPHFAPTYPGVTDVDDFRNWKVPFEVDRKKIKKEDDDYWHRYRTTPKVFVNLDDGRKLWATRFGDTSGLRLELPTADAAKEFENKLLAALEPAEFGFAPLPVRAEQLKASGGSTPFDVLFLAFSFFLIASAALIVALLFRLNVERRARQAGLLAALGTEPRIVRRLLLAEGLILAVVGSALGTVGAVWYARLMIDGLAGRWRDAVSTSFVTFHWTTFSLVVGWFASTLTAALALWWASARLVRTQPARLLAAGFSFGGTPKGGGSRTRLVGISLLAVGAVLPFVVGRDNVGGFFGAGMALLAGALASFAAWLSERPKGVVRGAKGFALVRLGARNASRERTRSLLTVGLIAFAAFIVAAVSAFRHDDEDRPPSKNSGDGGFALVGESASPLFSPVAAQHSEELKLDNTPLDLLKKCDSYALRVRAGEDASCLNVYRPNNPTLLGVDKRLRERGGFAFAGLLSGASAAERDNPWRLLERDFGPDVLPVVGDAETMQYILQVGVGGDLEIPRDNGKPLKLRFVASLQSSIFQGQLLAGEERLLDLFPGVQGFRYFLLDAGSLTPTEVRDLGAKLELDLTEAGFEVQTTGKRLAAYHAVANTYISTFQTLGGFGLLLGTLGLVAVLLRNVFERRGELALLRAVGFSDGTVSGMVLAENLLLLFAGVLIGALSAGVAILPQWLGRHEPPRLAELAAMLLAVLAVGTFAGWLAARLALRSEIVPALRAE